MQDYRFDVCDENEEWQDSVFIQNATNMVTAIVAFMELNPEHVANATEIRITT